MRKLFTEGTRYRENSNILREKSTASIIESLNDCINTLCNKYGIDNSVPTEWKSKIFSKVHGKIKYGPTMHLSNIITISFKNKKPLQTLNRIHNDTVITPTDKVNRNVAFICQKMLCSCPYERSRFKINNQVISDHATSTENKFSLYVGTKTCPWK